MSGPPSTYLNVVMVLFNSIKFIIWYLLINWDEELWFWANECHPMKAQNYKIYYSYLFYIVDKTYSTIFAIGWTSISPSMSQLFGGFTWVLAVLTPGHILWDENFMSQFGFGRYLAASMGWHNKPMTLLWALADSDVSLRHPSSTQINLITLAPQELPHRSKFRS